MDNTLKAHANYALTVRGRPTPKDVERFRDLSVSECYERSIYKQTVMSESFIEDCRKSCFIKGAYERAYR